MNVLGLMLAVALGSAPAPAGTAVNIDVRDANQWIGIGVAVKGTTSDRVSVGQEESNPDVHARITRDGSTIRVVAVYTGTQKSSFFGLLHWGSGHHVHWTVYVPNHSDLDVHAANGSVSVEGVIAPVAVATSNGGISITGAGPHVSAHSSNGGIHAQIATLAGGPPQIDIRSSNGGISLQVPSGFTTRVDTRTSNGGVSNPFANANGPGSATLHTSNGGISVSSGR